MNKNHITKAGLLENIQEAKKQDRNSLRKQLAYLYHVMDFEGWGDLIVTHASVRIPGTQNLLMAPYGLMFCEVTPDNLVEIDSDGNILNGSQWRVNNNGSKSHREIYATRPDINSIIHTHTKHGVALANLKTELLSLDQMSMMFHGKIAYHEYDSFFTHQTNSSPTVAKNAEHKCVILKNHGLIALGKDIAEAFWNYYYLELACQIQLMALAASNCDLSHVNEKIKEQVARQFDEWNEPEQDGFPGHADLAFAAAKRKLYLKKYYSS